MSRRAHALWVAALKTRLNRIFETPREKVRTPLTYYFCATPDEQALYREYTAIVAHI